MSESTEVIEAVVEEVITPEAETLTNAPEAPPTDERSAAQSAEEDAAFEAGFSGDHAAVGEQQPASEASGVNDASVAVVPPVPITADQLKELLAKVDQLEEHNGRTQKDLQKVYGKFGDIQRQLKAGGATRKVGIQNLKRVAAEYPDLAELLAGDLSDMPTADSGVNVPDIQTTDAPVDDRAAALEQENRALKSQMTLTEIHPDWKSIRDNPSLQVWLGTQTENYRSHFLASVDPNYIAQGLTSYKGWKEQSAAHKGANQSRLANAITPSRGGGTGRGVRVLDDNAAFEHGFKDG